MNQALLDRCLYGKCRLWCLERRMEETTQVDVLKENGNTI